MFICNVLLLRINEISLFKKKKKNLHESFILIILLGRDFLVQGKEVKSEKFHPRKLRLSKEVILEY